MHRLKIFSTTWLKLESCNCVPAHSNSNLGMFAFGMDNMTVEESIDTRIALVGLETCPWKPVITFLVTLCACLVDWTLGLSSMARMHVCLICWTGILDAGVDKSGCTDSRFSRPLG